MPFCTPSRMHALKSQAIQIRCNFTSLQDYDRHIKPLIETYTVRSSNRTELTETITLVRNLDRNSMLKRKNPHQIPAMITSVWFHITNAMSMQEASYWNIGIFYKMHQPSPSSSINHQYLVITDQEFLETSFVEPRSATTKSVCHYRRTTRPVFRHLRPLNCRDCFRINCRVHFSSYVTRKKLCKFAYPQTTDCECMNAIDHLFHLIPPIWGGNKTQSYH